MVMPCLVVAVAAHAATAPAAAQRKVYIPQWSVGDAWVMEVEVRDPRAMARTPKPDYRDNVATLASHIRYRFEVEKIATVKDLRFFEVKATGLGGVESGADLVFGGEANGTKVKSLFLVKALYTTSVAGHRSEVRRDYNHASASPFPVLNDQNNVPCDFPFLYADHGVDPAKPADGFYKDFQASAVVAGDLRSLGARQTYMFAPLKVRFPSPCPLPRDRTADEEVYIKALRDNATMVRQIWNPKFPWPVFTEGPRGRAWLVKVEAPSKTRTH